MALFLRKQDLYLLLESAIFFLFTTLNNNHISLVEVIQAILAWSSKSHFFMNELIHYSTE